MSNYNRNPNHHWTDHVAFQGSELVVRIGDFISFYSDGYQQYGVVQGISNQNGYAFFISSMSRKKDTSLLGGGSRYNFGIRDTKDYADRIKLTVEIPREYVAIAMRDLSKCNCVWSNHPVFCKCTNQREGIKNESTSSDPSTTES